MRVIDAIANILAAITGIIRFSMSPRPEVGSQSIFSEKKIIIMMPNQKVGTACPSMARMRAKKSKAEFFRMAAKMPRGTATATARSVLITASSIVAGIRLSTNEGAGS